MKLLLAALLISGACAAKDKPDFEARWCWGEEDVSDQECQKAKWKGLDETIQDVKHAVNRPVRLQTDFADEKPWTADSIGESIEELEDMKAAETEPVVSWMWADASFFGKDGWLGALGKKLAEKNLGRWNNNGKPEPLQKVIDDLKTEMEKEKETAKRLVRVQTRSAMLGGKIIADGSVLISSKVAIQTLKELQVDGMAKAAVQDFLKEEAEKDLKEGYRMQWMWADAEWLLGKKAAKANPFRWSSWKEPKQTATDLEENGKKKNSKGEPNQARPVHMKIKSAYTGKRLFDGILSDVQTTIDLAKKWGDQNTAAELRKQIEDKQEAGGYTVKWMWGDADAGFGNDLARRDPFSVRWSPWGRPQDVIDTLKVAKRPVRYEVEEIAAEEAAGLEAAIAQIQNAKAEIGERKVKWMWADASILHKPAPDVANDFGRMAAEKNPLRWTESMSVDDIIEDMKKEAEKEQDRKVDIKIKQWLDDWPVRDLRFPNRAAAINEIAKWPAPPVQDEEPESPSEGANEEL